MVNNRYAKCSYYFSLFHLSFHIAWQAQNEALNSDPEFGGGEFCKALNVSPIS